MKHDHSISNGIVGEEINMLNEKIKQQKYGNEKLLAMNEQQRIRICQLDMSETKCLFRIDDLIKSNEAFKTDISKFKVSTFVS